MRTIKFRGQMPNSKQWLLFSLNDYFENDDMPKFLEYQMTNICQFTGQKDKNGKEIYEGDILQTQIGKLDLVIFMENGFYGKAKHPSDKNRIINNPLCSDYLTNKEVIGNIHENPELLSTPTAVL